jgi:hypothetical protein
VYGLGFAGRLCKAGLPADVVLWALLFIVGLEKGQSTFGGFFKGCLYWMAYQFFQTFQTIINLLCE